MITKIRGADIRFQTSFKDETGASYSPASATLNIAYKVNGVLNTAQISMTMSGNVGTAKWQSYVADADQVDWFVTTPGSVRAVDQGSIMLVKNRANTGT